VSVSASLQSWLGKLVTAPPGLPLLASPPFASRGAREDRQ